MTDVVVVPSFLSWIRYPFKHEYKTNRSIADVQKSLKTEKQRKKDIAFPQRKYAVKA